MSVDYKLIGGRIKSARKRMGMTQETLAEKIDVSIGYVSQVERGITKISLDLLAKISTVLNCDISELVAESATRGDGYIISDIEARVSKLNNMQRKMLYEFIELIQKW